MTVKALSDFLPWVAPHVVSAPDPLIEQAVRDTCIDFCERTGAVQAIDAQNVVSGEPEYFVSAPTMQRLTAVLQVNYLDSKLAYAPVDGVEHGAALRAGLDVVVDPTRGTPRTYYQRTPQDEAIYLWPVPDQSVAGALSVRAAFAPTRTASRVEDVLFDTWLQTVVSGTLARLLMIPGQAYTSVVVAQQHAERYESEVTDARVAARRGAGRGSLRVAPRAFA